MVFSPLDAALSVLPGDGTGGFGPRTDFGAFPNIPRDLAIADVASDGKPDLLVAGGPLFITTCLP